MLVKDLVEVIDKDLKIGVYTERDKTVYEGVAKGLANDKKLERVVSYVSPQANSREYYLEIYVV